MNRTAKILITLSLGVIFACSSTSQQRKANGPKPAAIVMAAGETSAKIQEIDPTNRTVVLKFKDGKTEKVTCGREVRNFAQMKKGDTVKMEYFKSVAIAVEKKGTAVAPNNTTSTVEVAKLGEKPAGRWVNTTQLSAKVQSINHKTRIVTLKDGDGKTTTIKVADTVQDLDNVKKGDEVVMRVTEAFAISVQNS